MSELAFVALGVLIFFLSVALLYLLLRRKRGPDIPEDTVCLFQVGRGPAAPSLSPFPLKLETFLRMAKIPYMNDHSHRMSSKGKTPWMLYNGLAMADSQFCIEFLKQERGLDMDKHLTEADRAVARAMREMTEENLYWTMCHETFAKNPQILDVLLKDMLPWYQRAFFKIVVGRVVKKELWGHGMGRHSDAEVWDIGRRDLRALSHFLGTKSFLMGEVPTEVDCAVFGMLAMILWQTKGSRHEELVHDELKNLVKYCERMRDRFWPDWEERCVGDNFVDDHHKLYTF